MVDGTTRTHGPAEAPEPEIRGWRLKGVYVEDVRYYKKKCRIVRSYRPLRHPSAIVAL